MPLRRGSRLHLLAFVVASGAAVAARRLEVGNFAEAPDDFDAEPLAAAIARLERTVRAAPSMHPAGADFDLEEALALASKALARCHEEHCARHGVEHIVQACADIVHNESGHSTMLKGQALATLAQVASAGMTNAQGLHDIASMCAETLPQPDLHPYILDSIEAVARKVDVADNVTIEVIFTVAADLIEGRAFSDRYWQQEARFVLDALAIIGRFVERAGSHERAPMIVLRALKRIIDNTHDVFGYFPVRVQAMQMLETLAAAAKFEPVRLGILDIVSFCANVTDEEVMAGPAARILDTMAHHVDEAHLELVVDVCGRMLSMVSAQKALITVVKRLVTAGHKTRAEDILHLLAESFAAQRHRGGPLPCNRVVALLRELDQPEAPLHTALRLRRATVLRPELVLAVDDIVPPLPAERARSQIVEMCAEQSKSRLTSARAVLLATCLKPLRVGLGAARSFTQIARTRGGLRLSGVVGPGDFANIGKCLLRSVNDLEGVGAAEAERVAAELVDAGVPLIEQWKTERKRLALRDLCALAGNVHSVCMPEQ